jgi:hypothetical protein
MDLLKELIGPMLQDKHVWGSVALWALKLANTHFGFGMNDEVLTGLASALSLWTTTHLLHTNTVGAPENK